jgi:hypothetical protein
VAQPARTDVVGGLQTPPAAFNAITAPNFPANFSPQSTCRALSPAGFLLYNRQQLTHKAAS